MHFSERVPIIKWCVTVFGEQYLKSKHFILIQLCLLKAVVIIDLFSDWCTSG